MFRKLIFFHINELQINIHRISSLILKYSSFNSHKKYCALVRSLIEHGSTTWSPHTKKGIKRLEHFQNRFLSFAGYVLIIEYLSHYYDPISRKLNLSSLKTRGEQLEREFLTKREFLKKSILK